MTTPFFKEIAESMQAEGSRQGFEVIVAATPSPEGLGLAVHDRLTRASAPREPKG